MIYTAKYIIEKMKVNDKKSVCCNAIYGYSAVRFIKTSIQSMKNKIKMDVQNSWIEFKVKITILLCKHHDILILFFSNCYQWTGLRQHKGLKAWSRKIFMKILSKYLQEMQWCNIWPWCNVDCTLFNLRPSDLYWDSKIGFKVWCQIVFHTYC